MNTQGTNSLPLTEDLLRVAQFNAQKLALLLYVSTIPDEVKESISVLISEMTLEQINELLNILESQYLDQQTKDIDEEYERQVHELLENFGKKREKAEKEFTKQIELISTSF